MQLPADERSRSRHIAQFYRDEADLADRVAAFLAVPLLTGNRAALVATPAHARGALEQLGARGLDPFALRRDGRLLVLDATELLPRLAPGAELDRAAFHELIVERLHAEERPAAAPMRVYGEIVDLLARDGRFAVALELEAEWERVIAVREIEVMCGYSAEHMAALASRSAFTSVCGVHDSPRVEGDAAEPRDVADALMSISLLRQQVMALEAEVADRRSLEVALRRAQRELAEAQRIQATGSLAAGIAHHYNNLLCVIEGYAGLLSEALDHDPELALQVREIAGAAERASALTRQLMALTAPRQTSGPTELDPSLHEVWPLLRHQVPAEIALDLDCGAPAACVPLDAGELEQTLKALVQNARLAMPGGGSIEVASRLVDAGASSVARAAPTGQAVVLEVTDSGEGMSDEVRARAFEPFYTTRGLAVASGLGLATVHALVTAAGGRADLVSTPGQGTRVRLELPVAAMASHPLLLPVPLAPAAPSALNVLVVEDEDAVRRMVVAALRKTGYHVLEAGTAAEALHIATALTGELALLLTDVLLPDLDGPTLATRLRAARPEARVLFMSGHHEAQVDRLDAPLIEKPFTPRELVRLVHAELDRPALPTVG